MEKNELFKKVLIEEINKLQIINKAENEWEGTKHKPFTLHLIEKTKVLDIISAIEQPSHKKEYKCTDCHTINYIEDNGEIRVGFCSSCGHPLWNPPEQPSQPDQRQRAEEILEKHFEHLNTIEPNHKQKPIILKAMEEYRGQGIPEITDEEIEKGGLSKGHLKYGSHLAIFIQGTKWYREQIKNK